MISEMRKKSKLERCGIESEVKILVLILLVTISRNSRSYKKLITTLVVFI